MAPRKPNKRAENDLAQPAGIVTKKAKPVQRGQPNPVPAAPSQLAYKPELALFEPPPIRQNCIEQAEYVTVDPVTALAPDSTVIDFVLPRTVDAAYDLANLRFGMTVKLTDKTGNDVKKYRHLPTRSKDKDSGFITLEAQADQYDPVVFVNNPLTSLFSKVEVWINDRSVNSSNTHHPYRAFIQNAINYPTDARRSLLATSGFLLDTSEPASANCVANPSLTNRAAMTEKGRECHLYGKLSHDLFSLTRVLPIGTKVQIRLYRATNEFALMVDDANTDHVTKRYKVNMLKIWADGLRFRLSPQTISFMEAQLANKVAAYYFTRIEMRTFYIPPNSTSHLATHLFQGLQPSRVFFGFVETGAYQGSYTTNPLCFQHHSLENLSLRVDNRVVQPVLKPEWETPTGSLQAYVQFLKTLRVLNSNIEVEPTMEKYRKGPLTIYAYDLSPDHSDSSDAKRIGTMSLETTFQKPVPSTGLVCIVLATFYSSMMIDKFGNVELEDQM